MKTIDFSPTDTIFPKIYVDTSVATAAWDRLKDIHIGHLRTGVSRGLLVHGPSGAGKSALMLRYAESVNNERAIVGEVLPIAYVEMPSSPSKKNLSVAVLNSLGDKRPELHRQTAEALFTRVVTLLTSLKTEVLILDEAQHLVDYKDNQYEVGDWLKSLINTSKVTIVAVGMGRIRSIKRANSQVRRRFSAEFTFQRFRPGTLLWPEFARVIKTLQSLITVDRVDLVTPDVIQRLYFASHGLMDYLIRIIDRSTNLVYSSRYSCLDLKVLEHSFRDEVWERAPAHRNPFDQKFDFTLLDGRDEPYEKVDEDGN